MMTEFEADIWDRVKSRFPNLVHKVSPQKLIDDYWSEILDYDNADGTGYDLSEYKETQSEEEAWMETS